MVGSGLGNGDQIGSDLAMVGNGRQWSAMVGNGFIMMYGSGGQWSAMVGNGFIMSTCLWQWWAMVSLPVQFYEMEIIFKQDHSQP